MSKLLNFITMLVIGTYIHANEIQILDYNGETDVVEVIIKGKGTYCTVMIKNDIVSSTDCLESKNLKEKKFLCTKYKEICKTKNEILSTINQEFSNTRQAMQELQMQEIDAEDTSNMKPAQAYKEEKQIIDIAKRVDIKDESMAIIDKYTLSKFKQIGSISALATLCLSSKRLEEKMIYMASYWNKNASNAFVAAYQEGYNTALKSKLIWLSSQYKWKIIPLDCKNDRQDIQKFEIFAGIMISDSEIFLKIPTL